MRFTEINLYGIYFAPITAMMVAAALVLFVLLRVVARFGLLRMVWHPALFELALYIILLSSIILLFDREVV